MEDQIHFSTEKINEDILLHTGVKERSGRYPWGSGENPYQRLGGIQDGIKRLKDKGITDEKEIARMLGILDKNGNPNTSELRMRIAIDKYKQRAEDRRYVMKMTDKGYSTTQIARMMGKNESSVRQLKNDIINDRNEVLRVTADVLKESVDKNKYIDVGIGVERSLGVNGTKLKTAIRMLEDEGYKVYYDKTEQLGTNNGNTTSLKILAKDGLSWSEIHEAVKNGELKLPVAYSNDNGKTYEKIHYPTSINSKRVEVAYAEDGGKDKDGLIEIRRGVEDLDMGNSKYAQVRIAVDGTHYLKGMAVYSDDLPKGVDVRFNTKKSKADYPDPKETMKELEFEEGAEGKDPSLAFKATIIRQKGALNIVNEEDYDRNWESYSKNLSAQFLSKQYPETAKKQLNLSLAEKKDELKEIQDLTNPVLKRYYLNEFAEKCDSDSTTLKAASFPRQSTNVLLPMNTLKDNEIYAPSFNDGEEVILVRYPHAGTFEIPKLKVNNKNQQGIDMIGKDVTSAVGINSKVAMRLSGADFDGDTALVIPTKNQRLKVTKALDNLREFDTDLYTTKDYESFKPISSDEKQKQMGIVSNLITDMNVKGASEDELARAVRHSMVVIDAEKHKLDYKASYKDNAISALKDRYQNNGVNEKTGRTKHGASTLISRAGEEVPVPKRSKYYNIDENTGEKIYSREKVKKKDPDTGKTIWVESNRIEMTPLMKETKDAYELSTGSVIENLYADYANSLKSLANNARKEALFIKGKEYSPSARKAYSKEVASLNAKLNVALKNKPLERLAQVYGNKFLNDNYSTVIDENTGKEDKKKLKKLRNSALSYGRGTAGAHKETIKITDKEWEAIQAGAISNSALSQIFNNSDKDILRKYAMPKESKGMSDAKINRAQAMINSGYTIKEVAETLGFSTSTISRALKK